MGHIYAGQCAQRLRIMSTDGEKTLPALSVLYVAPRTKGLRLWISAIQVYLGTLQHLRVHIWSADMIILNCLVWKSLIWLSPTYPYGPIWMGILLSVSMSVMKTCLEQENSANPILHLWDPIASETRKPIEFAFGILKKPFPILRNENWLLHEDHIARIIFACVCLHYLSIEK